MNRSKDIAKREIPTNPKDFKLFATDLIQHLLKLENEIVLLRKNRFGAKTKNI